MFLATTALSEFWDKDQEILFLSSSCLRYDRRSELESLNYQVMPSPWDDREKFYHAAHFLDEIYERLLTPLGEYLNVVHQESHGQRYWRILIGPWLCQYLQVMYDRYIQLTEALAKHPGSTTYTLDPGSYMVPQDTAEWDDFLTGDACNLQIYSQILAGMGYDFPGRSFSNGWPETVGQRAPSEPSWGGTVKNAGKNVLRLGEDAIKTARGGAPPVALFNMYQPRKHTWTLALRTGLRAAPVRYKREWSFPKPDAVFDESRCGLSKLGSAGEFERIIVQSLPNNFPVLYLEGFRQAKSDTHKMYPKAPPVLASAVGWVFDEPFKFLAAAAAENGSRLVGVQHGGGYGNYRYSTTELHESSICDSFKVWGWADQNSPASSDLPNPTLSSLQADKPSKKRPCANEPVLFISTAHPRNLFRFHSCPVGSQFEDYYDWEVRFLAATPDKLLPAINFRPYHTDYGWCVQERISGRFPEIKWDKGQPIHRTMRDSRLIVIDHLSTSLLESLAANHPTVLFWDPERWEVRASAEPDFDSLRRVGILWDSPEAAAAKVASVYDDPSAWWGSEEVQDARRQFVAKFALGRKDWAACWARALKKEVALAEVGKD